MHAAERRFTLGPRSCAEQANGEIRRLLRARGPARCGSTGEGSLRPAAPALLAADPRPPTTTGSTPRSCARAGSKARSARTARSAPRRSPAPSWRCRRARPLRRGLSQPHRRAADMIYEHEVLRPIGPVPHDGARRRRRTPSLARRLRSGCAGCTLFTRRSAAALTDSDSYAVACARARCQPAAGPRDPGAAMVAPRRDRHRRARGCGCTRATRRSIRCGSWSASPTRRRRSWRATSAKPCSTRTGTCPTHLVRKTIAAGVLEPGRRLSARPRLRSAFRLGRRRRAARSQRDRLARGGSAARRNVRVRQRPGPLNAMGTVKFEFPNPQGIYLHDTPDKDLLLEDARQFSNGCIRLEDAERLGRWLLGATCHAGEPGRRPVSTCAEPVPVYITYLTVQTRRRRRSRSTRSVRPRRRCLRSRACTGALAPGRLNSLPQCNTAGKLLSAWNANARSQSFRHAASHHCGAGPAGAAG